MNKILSLVLSLSCSVAIGIEAKAAPAGENGNAPISVNGMNFNLDENSKTAWVTEGEYSGEIIIPEKVNVDNTDYTVVGIEALAFSKDPITSISIPQTITTIEEWAFMSCSTLETVNVGTGLEKVGRSAFAGCTALKKVNITDLAAWCGIDFADENANPIWRPRSLYLNDNELTTLEIPAGVTKIGDFAFANAVNITSVTIGADVETIGTSAFKYCRSATELNIPDNVTEIGTGAFESWVSTTTLNIGTGLKKIPEKAFYGTQVLESVTIPENITIIGKEAFGNSRMLTEVSVGTGLDSIKSGAFILCQRIQTVNAKSLDAWCRINFEDQKANPLTVKNSVLLIDGKELTTVNFPEGIGEVKPYTFYGCGKITDVTLPDDVTTIGAEAFGQNVALANITFGNNLTSIGSAAFSGCTQLDGIELPNEMTEIPSNLFSGCESLSTVNIPDGIVKIEDFAFSGCKKLNDVKLPVSIRAIGSMAFQNCESLDSVIIPRHAEVGMNAFKNCISLKYAKVLNPEKQIGYEAFGGCSSLEEIWFNTTFACYPSKFPANVTIYVPYGSVDEWIKNYGDRPYKQAGLIEVDGKTNYSTYYVLASYQMPEGIEGIIVSGVSTGQTLIMGETFDAGEKVPYATPLLIKSQIGDFYDMVALDTEDNESYPGQTICRGVDEDEVIMKESGKQYYRLGYNETGEKFGFMRVLDNGAFEMLAHTAYIEIPDNELAPEEGFDLEAMSSITNIATTDNGQPKAIYRIDGTRVYADSIEELLPGLYIIDGQKIIINK